MQICPKCKVNIRGEKSCCPLCQSQLKVVEGSCPAAFPTLKKKKISNITFLKVCTFIFLALETILQTFNYLTHGDVPIIGIFMLGTFVVWLTVLTTTYIRNNIIKVVTWEGVLAIVIDIVVDKMTGFIGWSIVWVVPCTLVALAIVTVVIANIIKLRLDEYILYIVFDLIMALLQIIFIRNGMNYFVAPAAISIMIYVILTIALVIFRFADLKNATMKMFNV